jgi:hypothetical protein
MQRCISLICFLGLYFVNGQTPFLEIRPYVEPDFVQYDLKNHVDHHYPTANIVDGDFRRFDGVNLTQNLMFPNCDQGSSCYDGHAGVDYYMPEGTPILAPANGYVIWSAFSPGADPCPGGISPNGETGIIILAHPGTDYFSCYLHLQPPLNVSVGQTVTTGDTLGFAGNTGCAQTPHLHFEIRKGSHFFNEQQSYAVDPFGWWGSESDPIESIRGNRSEWLWKSSWFIDDNDNGFQRYYGPMWDRMAVGYGNDCWVAPATTNVSSSRHYAIWVPELEQSGAYNIDVYIPSGLDAATAAVYEIYVKNENGLSEKTIVVHDQTLNVDNFSTIATLDLPAGSNCSVILRDVTDNSSGGSFVVFDAIRFTSSGTVGIEEMHNTLPIKNFLSINRVYPNPFNPSVTVDFDLLVSGQVSIFVTDLNGHRVRSIKQYHGSIGKHSIFWDGNNDNGESVSTGLYFLSIKAGNTWSTAKLLLLE